MNCPVDKAKLLMTDRQGVEIDYCPECRGVWLDRGELDKIIDANYKASSSYGANGARESGNDKYYEDKHYKDSYNQPYKKKKRENFLGDLFDF